MLGHLHHPFPQCLESLSPGKPEPNGFGETKGCRFMTTKMEERNVSFGDLVLLREVFAVLIRLQKHKIPRILQ